MKPAIAGLYALFNIVESSIKSIKIESEKCKIVHNQ